MCIGETPQTSCDVYPAHALLSLLKPLPVQYHTTISSTRLTLSLLSFSYIWHKLTWNIHKELLVSIMHTASLCQEQTKWLSKSTITRRLLAVKTSSKKQLLIHLILLPEHISLHFYPTAGCCSIADLLSMFIRRQRQLRVIKWSFSPSIASAPSRLRLQTCRSCTRSGLSRGAPDRPAGSCRTAVTTTMQPKCSPADQNFHRLTTRFFRARVHTFYRVQKIQQRMAFHLPEMAWHWYWHWSRCTPGCALMAPRGAAW